ncbi:MAG: PKD domain-containing protein [Bacteroidia bacterium]|nr:PKD domain-containing protein [Bacteroidia bacterium]
MKTIYSKLIFTVLFLNVITIFLAQSQQVSFTADQTNGCAPLAVNFTNTSTIDTNGVTFEWNFSDGGSFWGYNASHQFLNAQNYWVSVTAWGQFHQWLGNYNMNINVGGASSYFYISAGPNVCVGQEIYFWSNDQTYWKHWNFGNGDTANDNWPRCTYYSPGTYNVMLIESTDCGIDTIVRQVYVSDSAIPTVEISFNGGNYFCPGDDIYLRDNYPAVSYLWDFGDGSYSVASQPTHHYADSGDYRVILIATNMCGNSNSDTNYVFIRNNQSAYAGFNYWPNPACPGEPVRFDSWNSGNYLWSFGDGDSSTLRQPEHIYTDTGSYQIQLIVTNGCGYADTNVNTIFVQYNYMNPPNVGIQFNNFENWQNNQPVETLIFCPNTLVEFRGNTWSGGQINYHWDFGDGTTSDLQNPSHTFTQTGTNVVMLIAGNSCGASDTAYKYIIVDNTIMPQANLQNLPDSLCPGETVYFFDNNFREENNYSYSVWFGDGNSSLNITQQDTVIGVLATHIYNTPGTYHIVFTVINSCGNTDSLSKDIVVGQSSPANPTYYVDNSTSLNQHMNWANFGVPSAGDNHQFYIPIHFDQWVPGMNDDFYVVFWAGRIDFSGNVPDPMGLVLQQGLGTVHAYVPSDVTDSVTIAAAWFCDGMLEGDGGPDAFGILGVLPVFPNGLTNVPEPGIQIGGWSGNCDTTFGNPNAACPGDPVNFMAVGGLSYEWHFGDGSPTDTSQMTQHIYNTVGTYNAYVVITTGCGSKDTVPTEVTVSDQNLPYADFYWNSYNNCTGTPIQFEFSDHNGGEHNYTFFWDFGDGTTSTANTPSHVFQNAGQYMVTMIVYNNCGSDTTTQQIWVNGPQISMITSNGCAGENNGFIDITQTNGCNITFNWSNGATTDDIYNLSPGNYTVTVSDCGGCSLIKSVTIDSVQPIQLTTYTTNISCNGMIDGNIDLSVMGGMPPFYFFWSNNESTEDISGLAEGMYYITVVDAGGCSEIDSAFVIEPETLNTVLTKTDIVCPFGFPTGSVYLTVSGGTPAYSYNWSNGATTEDLSNIHAGSYIVTVTDSRGCTTTDSISVTEPPPFVISDTVITNPSCGSDNGEAAVFVSGATPPYTYLWSDALNQTNDTATGLGAGFFTVTVTDANNCSTGYSFALNNAGAPTLNYSVHNVSCYGLNDGYAVAIPSGGTSPYTYQWSNSSTNDTAYYLDVNMLGIIVTVTDSLGCETIELIPLSPPTQLQLTLTSTDVSCNGGNNGAAIVTPSGATPGYTFNWSLPSSNDTIIDLTAGTYSVTVTDANSCQKIDSVAITEPSAIANTLQHSDVLCYGGNSGAVFSYWTSGGVVPYSYLWSTSDTLQQLYNLAAGTYYLTITDANNCTYLDSVEINEPPALTSVVNILQNVTCNGMCDGSAVILVSGGVSPYSYYWSMLPIVYDSISTTLCEGNTIITVTDSSGCVLYDTAVITQPAVLEITMNITNPTCNSACDGVAVATVSGGTQTYFYDWGNGNTGDTEFNLCEGAYTITVTDAHGCIDSATADITNLDVLIVSVQSTNILCHGANDGAAAAIVTGGIQPYTYNWSNGDTTETPANLPPDTLIISVTDANNCAALDTVIITGPDTFIVTVSSQNVSCYGYQDGSVSYIATGGTQPYEFSIDGNIWTTDTFILSLAADDYYTIIRDAHSCQYLDSATITQPDMILTSVSFTDALCFGSNDGAAGVTVSGDFPPFIFAWTDNVSTTDTASGLVAGNYYITVTDSLNCSAVDSVLISEPDIILTILTNTNVLCFGDTTGSASISVTGGTPLYSIVWSNGELTQSVDSLTAGTYHVTVTDGHNCTVIDSVAITEPDPLTLTASVTNASAIIMPDGAIDLNVTGGTPTYTYLWNNFETTQDISDLFTGNYSVTVTDANGCTDDTIIFVDFSDKVNSLSSDNVIKIYPNPTSGLLYITNAENTTIELANIIGEVLITVKNPSAMNTFDLSKLAKGNYFIRITKEGNTITRKVVLR